MNADEKIASYRELAQEARRQAAETNLRSKRDSLLRSAARWEEETAKAEKIQRMKVENDEATAMRPSANAPKARARKDS
jgi:hypothetical protein